MVQQQIYEEVTRVLNGRVPTADDVPNLPLIRGLVKETLRYKHLTLLSLIQWEMFSTPNCESVSKCVLCVDCRLYPVLPGNGRITQDNLIVGGYFIPKGVRLGSVYLCVC